ncbi:MAG: ABC transporter ATP-binding protein [Planctomycetes bacterium]|nr:ABC transporter ATP-binding protein [Planctomycetota bacterium]
MTRCYARWPFGARVEVLRGVDLELARGATLGLAGPNGSGKSTLLRLLAGVEEPDAGLIRVLGTSPRQAASEDRVGWLPDDTPFPRDLSLRAALRLAGAIHGLRGRALDRRAEERLERVGLASVARRPLGRASRGMLRRFGIAQAWIHDPELVLLDEPTAGLDAEGYVVLASILDEARARGTTVVIASHASSDLAERCDSVAVLHAGRVALHAPPGEVFAHGGLLEVYRRLAGSGP